MRTLSRTGSMLAMSAPYAGSIESTSNTLAPSSTKRMAKLLPMKPIPPVINTRRPAYDELNRVPPFGARRILPGPATHRSKRQRRLPPLWNGSKAGSRTSPRNSPERLPPHSTGMLLPETTAAENPLSKSSSVTR